MDWEGIFFRLPHIGQEVLGLLTDKDHARCREASRSWKGFIDFEEIVFQRILKFSPGGLDPLLLAAWYGQTSIYETRSKNLVNKNPDWGGTGISALHWAAQRVDCTLVETRPNMFSCKS